MSHEYPDHSPRPPTTRELLQRQDKLAVTRKLEELTKEAVSPTDAEKRIREFFVTLFPQVMVRVIAPSYVHSSLPEGYRHLEVHLTLKKYQVYDVFIPKRDTV